jgi:hypothetical protein
MYAQIFLGIWMLVNAILHFFGVKIFLKKSAITTLSKEELASYQRGLVLPYTLFEITRNTRAIIFGNFFRQHVLEHALSQGLKSDKLESFN